MALDNPQQWNYIWIYIHMFFVFSCHYFCMRLPSPHPHLHTVPSQNATTITSEKQSSEQNGRNVFDQKQDATDIVQHSEIHPMMIPAFLNLSDTICNVMVLVLANQIGFKMSKVKKDKEGKHGILIIVGLSQVSFKSSIAWLYWLVLLFVVLLSTS